MLIEKSNKAVMLSSSKHPALASPRGTLRQAQSDSPFLLFTILLLFTTSLSFSQPYTTEATTSKKVQKLFEEAKGFIMKDQLDECMTVVQKAITDDPQCIDLYEMEGSVYYQQQKFSLTIPPLVKVEEMNPDCKSKLHYFLTISYWNIDSFELAISEADKYMKAKDAFDQWAHDAKRIRENSLFTLYALKHPVPFNPINLGDSINTTTQDEYSPSISADNSVLIFNRNVKRGNTLQEYLYISHNISGVWTKAREMGPPFDVQYNIGAEKISADGNVLYLTICDKPGDYGSCDIYTAHKEGSTWRDLRNVGYPISLPTWDSQPSISADGKDLYFVSSGRPDNVGGKDIYVSHRKPDGTWGIPEDLGDVINTVYDEEYPYIHPDNRTLYFSSNGHPGMGGEDIYVSRKGDDGKWTTPVDLGYPINTKGDDNGLVVSIDGKTAYYASTPKGRTDLDLYKFELPENMRPIPTTYVKGFVTDKINDKPVSAQLQLIDLASGKVIMNVQAEIDGSFLESLPSGSNYELHVSKPGYLFYSANFELKEPADKLHPYIMNIPLQPVAVGNSVVLKNVFFDVNSSVLKDESKSELNKLVAFLTANPKIAIEIGGHTDNTGNEATNKTLSESRAKSVYEYLIANKIDASRLTYKGYGSSQPIADNNTEEGKAQNRRTEFKIVSMQ